MNSAPELLDAQLRIRKKTRRSFEVWAHPGPRVWDDDHYGDVRKLHPSRASTRGVLLERLRSYEHRGSARQTGLRPSCLALNRASPMRAFLIVLEGLRARPVGDASANSSLVGRLRWVLDNCDIAMTAA
jgi:hypothetical protein